MVENGRVAVRPIKFLAPSYDHRIIDGREAVLSLVAIKDALEDPVRMRSGVVLCGGKPTASEQGARTQPRALFVFASTITAVPRR